MKKYIPNFFSVHYSTFPACFSNIRHRDVTFINYRLLQNPETYTTFISSYNLENLFYVNIKIISFVENTLIFMLTFLHVPSDTSQKRQL